MKKRFGIVTIGACLLTFGSALGVQAQERGRDRRRDDDTAQARARQQEPAVTKKEQKERIRQEQRRSQDYQRMLDNQVRNSERENARLREQKREAEVRAQERYQATLRAQQEQLRRQRDYDNDPYISTPHSYRYRVGNGVRMTNQYGAQMLQRAVNDGYQQGYEFGRSDRDDHRRSDYRSSYGYRDASYGYSGSYIDRGDYQSYFRQGFQRGYDDGFNQRQQYGSVGSNGGASILSAVLGSILGFEVR
jgi:hypothetical protein